MSDENCATCRDVGRRGYCALGRCYCGHPACPAFASYIDLAAIPLPQTPKRKTKPTRSSWDDREDSTWIDQL